MRTKNWYKIENAIDTESATIHLYDEIGGYGISASEFCKDLSGVTSKNIMLKINSPGGSVFDGCAIYNALKEHAAIVTVHVDGLAASIASAITMAGDKIIMAKNAMLMLHCAWSGIYGNAAEMRKTADVLAKIDGTLVDTYAERTGMGKRAVKQMMDDETWLTAAEALKAGFCDSIGTQPEAKACFDLSKYSNTPKAALALYAMKIDEPATERELEQILRDAGVSNSKAKAAVAAIKGEHRDDAQSVIQAINRAAQEAKTITAMKA